MNKRSCEQLELDKVLDELARRAATAPGARRARSLSPSCNIEEIANQLHATSEARELLETVGCPPFAGLEDIRALLAKVVRGGVPDGKEVARVGAALHALRRLHEFFTSIPHGSFPCLERIFRDIQPDVPLENKIFRCVNAAGEVLDSASSLLKEIRRDMHTLAETIQVRVQAIASDRRLQGMLQESLVTIRNGRYCVPVKMEFKGEFAGIVHDRSGSGATVFVEPIEIVHLNNQLRELYMDEAQEVERILKDIAKDIAASAEQVDVSLLAAFELDLVIAKGQLSRAWSATSPLLNSEGIFDLRAARHPLLYEQAVPVDMVVGGEFLTLLITGPNAGGKTVALKTAGLLTLMAQCGLHIPADAHTRIGVTSEVYCDIGDEQSIASNLSTFSAHLCHIAEILTRARPGSLVLLDEIGTGTDPDEGAALAKAVLEELTARECHTIATSHHGALKAFVHTHPRMQNASVEFDPHTFLPTFRIRMGTPGSSHALAIAALLGMPESVLQRARAHIQPDRMAADRLMESLESQRRTLEAQLADLQRDRERLEHSRATLESDRVQMQQQYAQELEEVARRAREMLAQIQREADDILRALRAAERESAETERQRQRLRAMQRKAGEFAATATNRHIRWDASLQPGHTIRIRSANRTGILLTLPDDAGHVWVRAGNMKVEVDADQIERVEGIAREPMPESASVLRLQKALSVADTIDLRGRRVEEALAELDKYLDDASLGELDEVRITHGIGTGALRDAIHGMLARHPCIAAYRTATPDEGGVGTTIAELRR